MKKTVRSLIVGLLAVSALSLAVTVPAGAAVHHAMKDKLVVNITNTGTTWGTVTVDYKSGGKMHMVGSCSKTSCTFHTPHMVKLTLKEKPVSSATWPFAGWTVKTGGKTKTGMASSISFTVAGGKATVTAKYVLK